MAKKVRPYRIHGEPKHCMVQVKFPRPLYRALKASASEQIPPLTPNMEMFRIAARFLAIRAAKQESNRKFGKVENKEK